MKIADKQKHILVSILGRTPQLLTEALYALMVSQKIPISEIWVLTTPEGVSAITQDLIHPHFGKFFTFCQDWQIDAQKIKFNTENILVAEDLSTSPDIKQCEPLVNLILNVLRNLTSDPNTVLHCSLAGGRKTMSVYFAYALQFFGRQQDKLYHVLVNPSEFENHPDFFYVPPRTEILMIPDGKAISTDQAKIELIEVPYIRLRDKMTDIFGERELNFNEMVQITQQEIEQMQNLPLLTIDSSKKCIYIGDKAIELAPIEMSFYLYYAQRSFSRNDKIALHEYEKYFEYAEGSLFPAEGLKKLLKIYQELSPEGFFERFNEKLKKGTLEFDRVCQYISRIKSKIRNTLDDDSLSDYYIISAIGRYGKCYGIKLDKSRIIIQ